MKKTIAFILLLSCIFHPLRAIATDSSLGRSAAEQFMTDYNRIVDKDGLIITEDTTRNGEYTDYAIRYKSEDSEILGTLIYDESGVIGAFYTTEEELGLVAGMLSLLFMGTVKGCDVTSLGDWAMGYVNTPVSLRKGSEYADPLCSVSIATTGAEYRMELYVTIIQFTS